MINIDMDETRHLVIVADDGHRTVLSMAHQDGVQLFEQLTEYYGRIEYGEGDARPQKTGLLARLKAKFLK